MKSPADRGLFAPTADRPKYAWPPLLHASVARGAEPRSCLARGRHGATRGARGPRCGRRGSRPRRVRRCAHGGACRALPVVASECVSVVNRLAPRFSPVWVPRVDLTLPPPLRVPSPLLSKGHLGGQRRASLPRHAREREPPVVERLGRRVLRGERARERLGVRGACGRVDPRARPRHPRARRVAAPPRRRLRRVRGRHRARAVSRRHAPRRLDRVAGPRPAHPRREHGRARRRPRASGVRGGRRRVRPPRRAPPPSHARPRGRPRRAPGRDPPRRRPGVRPPRDRLPPPPPRRRGGSPRRRHRRGVVAGEDGVRRNRGRTRPRPRPGDGRRDRPAGVGRARGGGVAIESARRRARDGGRRPAAGPREGVGGDAGGGAPSAPSPSPRARSRSRAGATPRSCDFTSASRGPRPAAAGRNHPRRTRG